MENDNSISQVNIPDAVLLKWQNIADIMATLLDVPVGLIMRHTEPDIEVFVSSLSGNNPYKTGDKENLLGSGLYCEAVITRKNRLLIPNALSDDKWKNNPDIKLNMISYLGFPLLYPDETPFGTICVLDTKENEYNETYESLILNFKEIIEGHLELLYMNQILGEKNRQLSDYISEIQTLRKIVPICCVCKKIRDDTNKEPGTGEWMSVENFLYQKTGASPSSSYCPECLRKVREETEKMA
jgi:GAF domain-containing protein